MTAKERVDDIMRRCWWKPEQGPHPGFEGLGVEIEKAINEAVAEALAEAKLNRQAFDRFRRTGKTS